jgi:hypothetical protein
MSLAVTTVCAYIAALNVPGLTIYDLSNIPVSGERIMPCLFPNADNPLSNFVAERKTFGGGSSVLADADYDLNYLFMFCELGAGRTGLDFLEAEVEMWQAIVDEIMEIDTITGAVDVWPVGNMTFGVYADPSGKQYHGCAITFHVKEFWR